MDKRDKSRVFVKIAARLSALVLIFGAAFALAMGSGVAAKAAANDDALKDDPEYQGLPSSGVLGGITEENGSGVRFYYQVLADSPTKAVISGYTSTKGYVGELRLPSKITYTDAGSGESAGSGTSKEYTVVGVNGGVFRDSREFDKVVFGESYEWVRSEAFMGSSISDVEFNDNIKSIEKKAFYASQITSIALGSSVNDIGDGAFANCQSLKQITVDSRNPVFCTDGGILYKKGENYKIDELVQCPAALESASSVLVIGSAACPIRLIRGSAFEGCTWLQRIDSALQDEDGFYESVKYIGDRAFAGCVSLSYVDMSENTAIEFIGDPFAECSPSLVFECIKDSVAERYARDNGYRSSVTCTVRFFDGGTLLKTQAVSYGGSAAAPIVPARDGYTMTWDKTFTNVVQNIDVHTVWHQNFNVTFKDAYSGQVTQVQAYYGGAAVPPIWKRDGYLLSWDTTAYNYVTKDMTVNAVWMVSMTDGSIADDKPEVNDTRTIGSLTYLVTRTKSTDPRVKVVSCKKKSTLTKVEIPATVTFDGVKFKVTNIGEGAFRGMPKLKKVIIGKNVIKINRAAFYNCPKLKTIRISSKKLSSVVEKSFSKIYSKAKVNVPAAYINKYKRYMQDAGLSTSAKVY